MKRFKPTKIYNLSANHPLDNNVEIDADGDIRLVCVSKAQDIWLTPKEWKRLKKYVKAATIKEENA
jgi:hypothetical protein